MNQNQLDHRTYEVGLKLV